MFKRAAIQAKGMVVLERNSRANCTFPRSPLRRALRACLKTRFGVPPLGGAAQKPPKGGTPNLPQRVSMVFFKQALKDYENTDYGTTGRQDY